MLKERRNQCVVISGESGSGKTESTNFLLHHLTALSQKGSHGSGVEQTILSAGPVLEVIVSLLSFKSRLLHTLPIFNLHLHLILLKSCVNKGKKCEIGLGICRGMTDLLQHNWKCMVSGIFVVDVVVMLQMKISSCTCINYK
jgi:hypothetical protein